MTRTQIQLPDQLYRRAKAFAVEREVSLAEVTRRGLEMFLDRHSSPHNVNADWKLPRIDAGGIKVPLDQLRDFATEDESTRGLPRE